MKKSFIILFFLLFISMSFAQITTVWQRSAANSSLPSWFSPTGNTERGLAYGVVGGNQRVYVVSRNITPSIRVLNALTGADVDTLRTIGITGGTFTINDVEVSSNGVIYVCNLTTNASTMAFKVYRYTSEVDTPFVVINYTSTSAARLGDKITVTGSTTDNSVTIWAASATTAELYKFTTTNNGVSFTPTIIPLSGLTGSTFGSASVGPFGNFFYWNAGGFTPQKYNADGTLVGSIPGTIVATGSNAIRHIATILGDEYLATFAHGTGNENARIVRLPAGDPTAAAFIGKTDSLGVNSNPNGTGDVAIRRISEYQYQIFVLSTNNGIGAYNLNLTPSLSGNYYIGAPGTGPGGSNPQFASLREAYQVINNSTFSGNCTFFITSNITESYTPAVGLGLAANPEPYTITFKPFTGVQPTITLPYPTDLNSGPSGAMIIGIPMENNISWNDLRVTKNIIFDGSNTNGGTTRDLTITTQTTSHGNAFPFAIVGAVSNIVIKNCNIIYNPASVSTSNLFRAAVQVRARIQNGVDWVPSKIFIENNYINANHPGMAQGSMGVVTVSLAVGGQQPTAQIDSLFVRNNIIEGKQRAIALGWSANTTINNNTLILNQNISGTIPSQVILATNVSPTATVNIYNNVISSISSMANGSTAGIAGISIESAGTYNVYNNMITGFNLTATNPTAFLRGIAVTSATATANIIYNTILMNDIPSIGTGTVSYNGIFINNGTNTLRNNIVSTVEPDFTNYCINRTGTDGTVSSNFNNFYRANTTNGNIGFWNNTATPTLANWQTASGQDANSKSKQVFFVSATDLHLTGSSVGDFDLAGTPIPGITTDIDGQTRHPNFPYMGADEANIPLPVELISFSANYSNGKVHLNWVTASELNNSGFEVERNNGNGFEKIGFVKGNGTTNQRSSFTFIDENPGSGKIQYRLKQIDFDGTFNYYGIVEVDVDIPSEFNLSQNYPNPVNPTTTIEYTIAKAGIVNLIVYNMLGEEVVRLVDNQFNDIGKYSIKFDASKLASGTYIYRLQSGDVIISKKMNLIK